MNTTKITLFSLLLFLLSPFTNIHSQTGYFFDINRIPIPGYLEPLNYSPKEAVEITKFYLDYEPGFFIDHDRNQSKGLLRINYATEKLEFKIAPADPFPLNSMNLKKFQSCIIGKDSFFVITAPPVFNNNGGVKRKEHPVLVQEIGTFDKITFAYAHFLSPGVQTEKMLKRGPREKVFYTTSAHKEWTELTENDSLFSQKANQFFGHIPLFQSRLSDGYYSRNDAYELCRDFQLYHHFQTKAPLFVSRYWGFTQKVEKGGFRVMVDSVAEGLFSLSFYNTDQGKKRFSIQLEGSDFKSKEGFFTIYGPNEEVHSKTAYSNNKMVYSQTFYPNGRLHHHYTIEQKTAKKDTTNYPTYLKVLSPSGEQLSEEIIDDMLTGRKIHCKYENGRLAEAFTESDGRQIYQLPATDHKMRIKGMQYNLRNSHFLMNIDEALSRGATGLLFVNIVVNEKGEAEKIDLLNSLHPELDQAIEAYFESTYLSRLPDKPKFRKMKIDGEKVAYETVFPIYFNTQKIDLANVKSRLSWGTQFLQGLISSNIGLGYYIPIR